MKGGISQTEAILTALQAGRRLTPLDALNEFGCFRLGARVWDLRQRGHNIKSDTHTTDSGARVAVYYLADDDDAAAAVDAAPADAEHAPGNNLQQQHAARRVFGAQGSLL